MRLSGNSTGTLGGGGGGGATGRGAAAGAAIGRAAETGAVATGAPGRAGGLPVATCPGIPERGCLLTPGRAGAAAGRACVDAGRACVGAGRVCDCPGRAGGAPRCAGGAVRAGAGLRCAGCAGRTGSAGLAAGAPIGLPSDGLVFFGSSRRGETVFVSGIMHTPFQQSAFNSRRGKRYRARRRVYSVEAITGKSNGREAVRIARRVRVRMTRARRSRNGR